MFSHKLISLQVHGTTLSEIADFNVLVYFYCERRMRL